MPTTPLPSSVHLDQYLTTFAYGYDQRQAESVAMRAFTPVPVQMGAGKYKYIQKGAWFRDEVKVRPLGGAGDLATYGLADGVYACEEYSLRHRIDDRVQNLNSTAFDLLETGTNMLLRKHMIRKDRLWSTSYFKTGVWGTDWTGVATGPTGNQFLRFDQTGADPIGTVARAKVALRQATGFTPNVLVLGADVELNFTTNPALVDRIKYGAGNFGPFVNQQILAQAFGVQDVVTPSAVYNSAAEGQADTMTWIIDSKAMLLLYRADRAALDGSTPTAGAVFTWEGLIPGANPDGAAVERRRAPPETHSDEIEVRSGFDIEPVALDLGAFFASAVP